MRRAVITALGQLGAADGETVQWLSVHGLDRSDRVLRQSAVGSLGAIGVASDAALDAIVTMLEDGPRSPRVTALVALAGVADDLRTREKAVVIRVVRAVTEQLPASDIDVNQQAALVLGSLGAFASSAVPALVETLRVRRFSRSQVAHALAEIGTADDSVLAALHGALESSEGHERVTIQKALERLESGLETAQTPSKEDFP